MEILRVVMSGPGAGIDLRLKVVSVLTLHSVKSEPYPFWYPVAIDIHSRRLARKS
jgi:hypothetical protein